MDPPVDPNGGSRDSPSIGTIRMILNLSTQRGVSTIRRLSSTTQRLRHTCHRRFVRIRHLDRLLVRHVD